MDAEQIARLAEIIPIRKALSKQKDAIEKEYDDYGSEIAVILIAEGLKKYTDPTSGLSVSVSDVPRSTVDAKALKDLMLEQGWDADKVNEVIGASTNQTWSTQTRITAPKEKAAS